MSPDIITVKNLLKDEKIWNAAKHHMEKYHSSQTLETRVFSPSVYTVGEQRPKIQGGRKRKNSDNIERNGPKTAQNGPKTTRGKRNGQS